MKKESTSYVIRYNDDIQTNVYSNTVVVARKGDVHRKFDTRSEMMHYLRKPMFLVHTHGHGVQSYTTFDKLSFFIETEVVTCEKREINIPAVEWKIS